MGKIVHLVANDVFGDSRVRKIARECSELGLKTLVVGTTGDSNKYLDEPFRVTYVSRPAPQPTVDDSWLTSLKKWVAGALSSRPRTLEFLTLAYTQAIKIFRPLALSKKARIESQNHKRLMAETPAFVPPRTTYSSSSEYKNREWIFKGFLSELRILHPDIIWVHDAMPLEAAIRFKNENPHCKVIYDAHENLAVQSITSPSPVVGLLAKFEADLISRVDLTVTVSNEISAQLCENYTLQSAPLVIRNLAPRGGGRSGLGLREELRLGKTVKLGVYSGWLNQERGLEIPIRALKQIVDLHLALVVPKRSVELERLLKIARALGVEQRIHLIGYVDWDELPGFLSSADFGLITRLPGEHLDKSLPTKFSEYISAGLPTVVANNKLLVAETLRLDVGVEMNGNTVDAFVSAVGELFSRRVGLQENVKAIQTDFLWDTEKARVRSAIEGALGGNYLGDRLPFEKSPRVESMLPSMRFVDVLIGTANYGSQDTLFAQLLRKNSVDALALSQRSKFQFDSDLFLDELTSRALQARLARTTHLIWSALKPIGTFMPGSGKPELDLDLQFSLLRGHNIQVAAYLRGSEIRDPDKHMSRFDNSPFSLMKTEDLDKLRRNSRVNRNFLEMSGIPILVSTPDLLDEVPGSQWLPHISRSPQRTLEHLPDSSNLPPLVLHAGTSRVLKGSDAISNSMEKLERQGLIRYRRISGMPNNELREQLSKAAIVVDQLRLGSYGVLAVEAMAAGAAVVGNIPQHVRDLAGGIDGIVQADEQTLEQVIYQLSSDYAALESARIRAQDFFGTFHSGEMSLRTIMDLIRSLPPLK